MMMQMVGSFAQFDTRWTNEAAFDNHAGLPHTVRFASQMETLIDHPLEVTRARPLG